MHLGSSLIARYGFSIFIVVFILLSLFGCDFNSIENQSNSKLTTTILLLENVYSTETPKQEFIVSTYLLSKLILPDSIVSKLSEVESSSARSRNELLMLDYLLWIQTQEVKYRTKFITNYPTDAEVIELNNTLKELSIRSVGYFLHEALGNFAIRNDRALKKFIGTSQFLDGNLAESATEQLKVIYDLEPQRVLTITLSEDVMLKNILDTLNHLSE